MKVFFDLLWGSIILTHGRSTCSFTGSQHACRLVKANCGCLGVFCGHRNHFGFVRPWGLVWRTGVPRTTGRTFLCACPIQLICNLPLNSEPTFGFCFGSQIALSATRFAPEPSFARAFFKVGLLFSSGFHMFSSWDQKRGHCGALVAHPALAPFLVFPVVAPYVCFDVLGWAAEPVGPTTPRNSGSLSHSMSFRTLCFLGRPFFVAPIESLDFFMGHPLGKWTVLGPARLR